MPSPIHTVEQNSVQCTPQGICRLCVGRVLEMARARDAKKTEEPEGRPLLALAVSRNRYLGQRRSFLGRRVRAWG
jgi:hypothetical protein